MKPIKSLLLTIIMVCSIIVANAQPITVTQPNGGEQLYGCQNYLIKWNSTGVSNFYNIDYSLNGGSTWSSITTNLNITNGQYNWTVPMATSGTVLIRVLDYNMPSKRDSSNAVFNVTLPINITAPNGGEVWQGLTNHSITWSPAGTSGIFNLSYSTDNGSTFTSIANNVAANNYSWNVPNTPSTNALVRVADATTSCQMDLSNTVFEISAAQPILTAPNGGEVWTINSNRNVTWNTATFHTTVKLEYSTDGGSTYNLITAAAPNTGSYTWTIPNTPSSQVRVRASNSSGSLVNDVSNADFTIVQPNNFITSPNGGEVWRSQNSHSITWDNTAISVPVKIEYSVNNGTTWNVVTNSAPNTGSYNWSIPSMHTTTQALVRLTSTLVSTIADTSNAVFTIKGPVTVDAPTTTLTTCSTVNIQWSRTTSFGNYSGSDGSTSQNQYDLYYSTGGGNWISITTIPNFHAQTSYSYAWTVPDIAPSSIKLRVSARYSSNQGGAHYWTDSSAVISTVNPSGTITVTNPNGAVNLNALTNYNVTWTASGTSGFFDVLYSVNGGTSYTSVASNISGNSYNWNVNNNPSTNVFVRVRDNQNICRKDASNAANTIIAATPQLTAPNGGEIWKVNSSQNITWNTASLHGSAYIEYSTDGGTSWNIVTASAPNNGTYAWTVPHTITTQALVRISTVGFPANTDASNAVFTINLPTPLITAPNGGEVWRSQNSQSITWDASTVASNVKIEYSTNNGTTWNVITNSASNTGSYNWGVPTMTTTTQALVRLTNVSFPSAMDTSNAMFTIKAPVTVDAPTTTLTTCSTVNIQWSRTTSFGNYSGSDGSTSQNQYDLYYSTGGGNWVSITTIPNFHAQTSYSYAWTVPDIAPSSIKLRVSARYSSNQGGAHYWTDSSAVISTVNPSGTITVTNPNGAVNLNALTNYNVTWTASGTSGFFDVLYSVNGGTSYTSVASNISGNSYNWNVNNNPSTNVFVRVRDNQNICRKDASNAANTIIAATPQLTAPNGGEIWKVNSSQNITWNTASLHGSAYIEYSTDGGTSWNIVTASAPNNGTYAWTVPHTITTQALVRISTVGFPANTDASNAVFTINLPTPLITAPNGGEVWRSQNSQSITWDASTVASNVKIEYSTNNGTTWNVITNSASNTGSYNWGVPTMTTTTQALVRLTNVSFPSAMDTSNAMFTIKAPVTVDAPTTTLTTCSTVNIQWSRTTSFGNYSGSDGSTSQNQYDLYYSTGGGNWVSITTIPNFHAQTSYSYAWTVPDIAPSSIKLRVSARYSSNQGGAHYWTDSSAVISTVNPSGTITVTNPNGAVNLNALTNYNVTWTASGTSGFFDVLYSVNGGTSYTSVASNISGNSYNWNVNNNPSTNVFVRVRDNQNICRKDASNAANTIIAATPQLTAPNGGEIWKVNSSQNITWNTASLHGSAYIEYSTDGGTSWNIVTASAPNNGTYAWTVPHTITTQALVRISTVGFPANTDASNAVFTINLPTPLITAPNGGEVWRSQNSQSITWDASTVASNVKIEYSTNNGTTWNVITNSASNTGSYNWGVPTMTTTTQALVRLTNVSFPSAMDTSNAMFTIKAPVTVDAPTTTLTTCSTVNIQWSRTTSFGNYSGSDGSTSQNQYDLYYSTGGGNWVSITTIPNFHAQTSYSYAWTVPDIAPSSIKLRVSARYSSNQGGAHYWTDSSAVISTVNPSGTITVTNPNGAVNLNALTNYNVTWTASGTSGFFDVLYSVNGGTSYTSVASNISGNSYNWNVNNNPSTNVFVRVRDNQNICRKDASNAANTIIAATPQLTAPNGGEIWKVNSSQNITWNTASLHGSAYIEYSTDGGTSWNIVTASAPNNGTYAWTVPHTITTQALVRISTVGFPANTDASNAVFTINLPTPLITAPNGGEVWRSQNSQSITWDASTVASNVKIEYSTNNGTTWNVITNSASNTGSYNWGVPTMTTTTQALVRLTNVSFPSAMDTSNAMFTIKAPVTVDAPTTTLTTCSTVNIQWSRTTSFGNYSGSDGSTSQNQYDLYYSTGGGNWVSITTIPNFHAQTSYSYAWTVPDIAPSSIKLRVSARYSSNQGGAHYWTDSSAVISTVNPSGTITVTNPNGAVNLNALTNYNVTWTASGTSGFFDVLYSVNGGTSYTSVASNISGNSYNWNVNNNPSTNVFVRVRDNQNICRKDASNALNTIIAATPIITAPNGGEIWNVNSIQNITWNTASLYGPAYIEYSTDGGATWNIVTASAPNTGTYAWTVPFTPSGQASIRISNVSNPSLSDVSNSVFTIQIPTPVITAPNGGETWYAGENRSITWTPSTFFSSTVNLEYSLDNGASWVSIATNRPNNGSYNWTLPNINSASALIRVSNSTNTAYYDVSDALLTLRPYVRLITPNGGNVLGSCTQSTISFEKAPTYTSFNIEYSVNNGANWTAIQTGATYNNTINNYNWSIPNNPSTQVLVRVYPVGQLGLADQSDATFEIRKAVTIIQPNYGGLLTIGSSYQVKWQSDGISNLYDLAYSTAGPGGPFTNIVIGYNTATNTYNWTVPNAPSTNCYFRIRDNINSCKEDISDMAFTISSATSPITVTAPNGGDSLGACQNYNITWTEPGAPIGNYNISYSIDYGTNWIPIVSNYATTSGSYNWTVPNTNVAGALIRVQSGLNPLVFDYSNALFAIQPGRLYTNADASICSGGSIQLNTTGGSTYSWTPVTGLSNPTIPNPVASPASTTQYIVSSTTSGCTIRDTVLITVNPNSGLSASVSISPSTSTAICGGTNVVYTATPNNGGATPSYQWKVNGANVGTNTFTYSTSTLNNGDAVTCVMTSALQCVANSPATSNSIVMTVNPNVTPSVAISTPQTSICSGTNAVFTATPSNGGGSPAYQWKKNGVNVGSNSVTYLDNTLVNMDVISVELTSNAACASPLVVLSNSIQMTINQSTTPSVSISASGTTICSGTAATFTAVATNSGATPSYQWKVNGTNAGTNSNTFSSTTLPNNAAVTCVVTSNAACNTVPTATSNTITMTVTTAPAAPVASSNSPVSTNGTINLFASTIAGATYSWTGPNGFSSSAQNPVIPSATVAMSGTYSVTATINTCTGSAGTTAVTVNAAPSLVTISGTAMSEIGGLINGVKLVRSGSPADSMTTSANGQYSFGGITQGASTVITPTKNNDVNTYNGITSLDLVLMQRHVLNTQLLPTPYKIIAADVNGSGSVTNLDILLTQSMILQNIQTFPGGKLWAFVNSSYVFPNPQVPFPYENSRSYSSANTATAQDFIGCKLGDVNNSWDPNIARLVSPNSIGFNMPDYRSQTGDIVTIPVTVTNFNGISGIQYTITWDPQVLEFMETANSALDMKYGTPHKGKLSTLWATENLEGTTLADGTVIFELKFRVIGQNGQASSVSINSDVTSAQAYDKDLAALTLSLRSGLVTIGDKAAPLANDELYALYQNKPNPFSETTVISFTIPQDDKVTISIYDAFGKKIDEMSGMYTKGTHSMNWSGTDSRGNDLSNGTYYYIMYSGKYVNAKKLVLTR